MLYLVFPQKSHEKMWQSIISEFEESGEKIPYALKLNLTNFDEYLAKTIGFHNNTEIAANFVPASTYFLMDEKQNKIFGVVSIRHFLNDSLFRKGGHIGYGIAPSERKKGYATKMLALALDICRKMELDKVLITCNKDNIGSAKTIIKNGGILENEITEDKDNGNIFQRYWINLNIRQIDVSDLATCLEVINKSFATVANEFGLTEQNCPTNPAFMKFENIQLNYDKSNLMYGYFKEDKIVGFVHIAKTNDDIYELGKLAVLPEYRHHRIGEKLISFVKDKVHELGGKKIAIGIIEENTRLKDWYTKNGFVHTGTQVYAHLPFTVGYMEKEIYNDKIK